MSDPLYKRQLLRLAADAVGAGRLPAPDATGEAFNPACGDRVTVELALKDGRVAAIAHETKACVLAQASASILGSALKGATQEDVEALANDLASMLVTKSGPPMPPFDAYAAFEGATEHRNRHRCVLLPLEAVLAALESAEPGGIGTER
jgi:NifU-like protein involved in Fe-S cluster formation